MSERVFSVNHSAVTVVARTTGCPKTAGLMLVVTVAIAVLSLLTCWVRSLIVAAGLKLASPE